MPELDAIDDLQLNLCCKSGGLSRTLTPLSFLPEGRQYCINRSMDAFLAIRDQLSKFME